MKDMIIKKVSFDCTIAMPGYNNVKPGIVEADLEPGETIEQAWSELNRRAMEWHKKEYPHCYEQRNPPLSYFAKIEPQYGGESSDKEQEESNAQLRNAVESLHKIQYKEDAEAFMGTEMWMKYNKIIKSIVNAKPTKNI